MDPAQDVSQANDEWMKQNVVELPNEGQQDGQGQTNPPEADVAMDTQPAQNESEAEAVVTTSSTTTTTESSQQGEWLLSFNAFIVQEKMLCEWSETVYRNNDKR